MPNLQALPNMNKQRVLLAFSGGLDTTYCAIYLREELGLEVHCALVDTGGFSESETQKVAAKAKALGVASYKTLHETEAYYNDMLRFLLFGNVLKNDTYPLSVSAERVHQATAIAKYANELGVDFIAHGSTGAGNDQVRFDLAFQLLAPNTKILTPIRDQQLSRQAEIDYLAKHGFALEWAKAKYSINQGLWGTSVGGEETLSSDGVLPESAWPTPVTATEPQHLTLHFKNGECVGLAGKDLSPVAAIKELQQLAAPYGIGRDVHVGDTIIGTKGRVGFEAAAPLILIKAHQLLEKHTLSKWQLHWKKQLSDWYGMFVHESQFLDPVMRDIEAFLLNTQQTVTGEVDIQLHPKRFEVTGIRSPYDLMNKKFGAYGETTGGWSGEDVKGFTKILANPIRIHKAVQSAVKTKNA